MLDEIGGACDPAHLVGLVAADVEIAMADLAVIFLAHGVIALADMDGDMDVVGQALDGEIDGLDPRRGLRLVGHGEQRLVDLDVPAAGVGQHPEIVAQQLAEIEHHLPLSS